MVVTLRTAQPPLPTDDGEPPAGFWLRDASGLTARVTTEPRTRTIRLRADGVEHPVEVFYDRSTDPEGVHLTDGGGLPTAPFRLRIRE